MLLEKNPVEVRIYALLSMAKDADGEELASIMNQLASAMHEHFEYTRAMITHYPRLPGAAKKHSRHHQ